MRRPLVVTLAALAVLAVLTTVAACSDDDDGGAVSSEPGDTETTLPPATTVATTPSGARLVNPTPGLNGVSPAAIDSVTELPNDKLEVRFYGGVVDCFGVDHIDVEEGDEAVTVTIATGTPPAAANRACIEIAELQAVIVALASPLNGRAVIDGSSGAEVPLS